MSDKHQLLNPSHQFQYGHFVQQREQLQRQQKMCDGEIVNQMVKCELNDEFLVQQINGHMHTALKL